MNQPEESVETKSPEQSCCSKSGGVPCARTATARPWLARTTLWGIFLLTGWFVLYKNLAPASKWLTYDLLGLAHDQHLSAAVEFFVFEVPKVLMLLVLVVFAVGIIRSFFTPERTRRILSGKGEFFGNILAALLGMSPDGQSVPAMVEMKGFKVYHL